MVAAQEDENPGRAFSVELSCVFITRSGGGWI